jgi:hypothetical protein
VEEALANGKDALKSTMAALTTKEMPGPTPKNGPSLPASLSPKDLGGGKGAVRAAERMRYSYHFTIDIPKVRP